MLTRPFPVLLDDAVTMARRRLLGVPFQLAVPLAVANAGWAALSSWFATGLAATADPTVIFGALGVMFAALPLFFAVQLAVYAVLGHAATARVLGEEITLREALRLTFRLRTIGTLLLAVFLLVGSFLLLVFPFFVVAGLLSFVLPVMLDEGRFGFAAISRSASLAWRNPRGLLQTWPLLLVMAVHTVFFAISTGLSFAVQVPVQIYQQVATFRQALSGEAADPAAMMGVFWLQVPLGVVTTVTSVIATWYLFHTLALLFRDTRERREATGLARALDRWVSPPAPPEEPA